MSQARITAKATTYIAGCRNIKQSIYYSCMTWGCQPQTIPQNAVWEIINENRLLQWHFEALKVSKNYVIARVCCLKYEKTTPTFIPLSWKSLTEDMEPDLCIRLPYFNWPNILWWFSNAKRTPVKQTPALSSDYIDAKIPARKPGRGSSPVITLPAKSLCLL